MQWDQIVVAVSMNVIPSVDINEVLIGLYIKYKNVKSEKMSFALFEASATDNKNAGDRTRKFQAISEET